MGKQLISPSPAVSPSLPAQCAGLTSKVTGEEEDEDEDEEESHICLQDPCTCGRRRKQFIWAECPSAGTQLWALGPHMLTKLISREMPRPEGLAIGENHLVLQLQPISLWGTWKPKGGSGQIGGPQKGKEEKGQVASSAPYPTLAECNVPPPFTH